MEFRQKFSDREWSFLSQLPYRIGLWMAHQDEGGGPGAFGREMDALEQAIVTSQTKFANVPMIASLAAASERLDALNDQWANALQDCRHALELLRPHADVTALNCFRLMLVDIAEAVARAAPNGDWKARNLYNGPTRGWLGLYPLMANAVRFGRGPKVTKPEKSAINALIAALDAGQIVQDWALSPFPEQA